jgi:NAD(P)-dependent dehydrogenase (short-subunit alcohol dehydrogenase family)
MATALRLDELDDTMALNYLSPARLTLALLPRMLARGRGAIVNLGSVAARMSPAGETAYSASKAALTAFSEGLAVELWDTPLTVHVIHPGIIETELFSLPDNDPSYSDDVEPLPTRTVVDAMVGQLAAGTFEVYVPEWFDDIASGKAANMQGFLAGSAEYLRVKGVSTGTDV